MQFKVNKVQVLYSFWLACTDRATLSTIVYREWMGNREEPANFFEKLCTHKYATYVWNVMYGTSPISILILINTMLLLFADRLVDQISVVNLPTHQRNYLLPMVQVRLAINKIDYEKNNESESK